MMIRVESPGLSVVLGGHPLGGVGVLPKEEPVRGAAEHMMPGAGGVIGDPVSVAQVGDKDKFGWGWGQDGHSHEGTS